MKDNKNNFRVRSPLLDNILSLTAIVSLIVLMLAAVSGVLWLLIRFGILSNEWWSFDPPTEETVVYDHNDGVFDALRPIITDTADDTEKISEIVRFSGSFSTLRALLSDLNAPNHYNALFETVIHSETGDAKSNVRVFRSDNAYRINRYLTETSSANRPTEYYICDGSQVLYTDNRTQTQAYFPVSESFSVEALAGIPSIASFNAVADDRILHASYAELNGEIVYYVLYTTPTASESNVIHEIWISAASELVQRCNTYLCAENEDPYNVIADADNILFSSTLISISDLSAQEVTTLFVLPQSAP